MNVAGAAVILQDAPPASELHTADLVPSARGPGGRQSKSLKSPSHSSERETGSARGKWASVPFLNHRPSGC